MAGPSNQTNTLCAAGKGRSKIASSLLGTLHVPIGLSSTSTLLSQICLWLLAGIITACSTQAQPAHSSPVDGTKLVVQSVSSSPDIALEIACTPTGPETCFDATDNNCNGAIDEGCGVHTGLVQFAIAWADSSVDVDLQVTDPSGESTREDDTTRLGLAKDRSCRADTESCQGQNTENVYLVGPDAPRGTYRVTVRLVRSKVSLLPVHVRFSARLGQRTWSARLEFGQQGEQRVISFVL